jgi:pilus assembly protein CpaB
VSRRKGWLFFVVGLILALGAGALVFVVLQEQAKAAAIKAENDMRTAYTPPVTMTLPVAARPLELGQTITPEDYIPKEFPLDLVPINAITQTADLDNQFLVTPVGQGETFSKRQFLGSQGATVSQQIPAGKVLFAFPIVDLMSKSNLIQDGDRIDLLLTMAGQSGDASGSTTGAGQVTGYTLQNIEVFKVLRTAAEDGKQVGDATSLLCSLTPEDAVLIKAVKDSGGTIDFSLRSPADKDPFQAPSINTGTLAERYNLR